ncbi:transcriptional regulatory protein AlgP-like [Schistocerca americana]|uniref:transcriptional regulatory protein AlgP-like n=1 Tax=Schistocerca americana TaxID=7009 RepID=UPI001F4FFC9B|nr:transcriptional regulatory protein AlgP-like [Schistocerca americana]
MPPKRAQMSFTQCTRAELLGAALAAGPAGRRPGGFGAVSAPPSTPGHGKRSAAAEPSPVQSQWPGSGAAASLLAISPQPQPQARPSRMPSRGRRRRHRQARSALGPHSAPHCPFWHDSLPVPGRRRPAAPDTPLAARLTPHASRLAPGSGHAATNPRRVAPAPDSRPQPVVASPLIASPRSQPAVRRDAVKTQARQSTPGHAACSQGVT